MPIIYDKAPATVVDVARSAGVSVGTVSRVLNHHPDVNQAIREKVLQAAQTLGYKRIRQRSKVNNKVETGSGIRDIGVICFGMEDTLVQLPVISTALQGIEHSLSAMGRSLLLANIPDGNRVPPFLQEGRIQGLILKGPNQGELPHSMKSDLLRAIYRYPHIWLMGKLPNATGDHCNFDTDVAGMLAAEHFAQKGHKRVAFMNPKPGQTQFERLKRSFLSACYRVGIQGTLLESVPPPTRVWPLPAITSTDNVKQLIEGLLAKPTGERETGIFVPSDRTAIQLEAALKIKGLQMGTDISVISCNKESSIISSIHPKLTTIDVHAESVGRMAVNHLLWRISHPYDCPSMQILVEPSLEPGESVVQL